MCVCVKERERGRTRERERERRRRRTTSRTYQAGSWHVEICCGRIRLYNKGPNPLREEEQQPRRKSQTLKPQKYDSQEAKEREKFLSVND